MKFNKIRFGVFIHIRSSLIEFSSFFFFYFSVVFFLLVYCSQRRRDNKHTHFQYFCVETVTLLCELHQMENRYKLATFFGFVPLFFFSFFLSISEKVYIWIIFSNFVSEFFLFLLSILCFHCWHCIRNIRRNVNIWENEIFILPFFVEKANDKKCLLFFQPEYNGMNTRERKKIFPSKMYG